MHHGGISVFHNHLRVPVGYMTFLNDFFEQQYDCPPNSGERVYYFICGAPRVGSNLLCDLLQGSGVMGAPAEYFNSTEGMKQMAERLGLLHNDKLDLSKYIETLKKLRTTPNGVFGAKVQYWMLPPLIKGKLISKHFPDAKFIFLSRLDAIAQGVSLELAWQTGQWTSLKSQGEATYDEERIRKAVRFVLNEKVSWEAFFALNEIQPLRLTYERLVQETENVCREICAHVGVETDYPFSIDKAHSKRQRNRVNEEWIRRIKESSGF